MAVEAGQATRGTHATYIIELADVKVDHHCFLHDLEHTGMRLFHCSEQAFLHITFQSILVFVLCPCSMPSPQLG